MAAGDPIVLGSATSATLVPRTASEIKTDDFGIQRGRVSYFIGDQSNAQGARIAEGTVYGGTLPQFSGFYVESPGDISGGEGKTATVEIRYAKVDSLWLNRPERSHDLQLITIGAVDTSGFGAVYETLSQTLIPIPHQRITYKYGSATYPSSLGTYGNPANAPTIGTYTVRVQQHAFDGATIDIERKEFTSNVTQIVFDTSGHCTTNTTNVTATVTGVFADPTQILINPININFVPDLLGWFCDKEEVRTLAAGNIYAVEQSWKRNYIFNGISPGSWWTGSHQVHCT